MICLLSRLLVRYSSIWNCCGVSWVRCVVSRVLDLECLVVIVGNYILFLSMVDMVWLMVLVGVDLGMKLVVLNCCVWWIICGWLLEEMIMIGMFGCVLCICSSEENLCVLGMVRFSSISLIFGCWFSVVFSVVVLVILIICVSGSVWCRE